jgi:Zn-dependent alcohol dehydrogenase
MTSTTAIVSHEPKEFMKREWTLDIVALRPPGDDEVLVEMHASGICHTDILLSSVPTGALGVQYPKVVGHEGIFDTLKFEAYPAAINKLEQISQ